jgi:hypothetical protein
MLQRLKYGGNKKVIESVQLSIIAAFIGGFLLGIGVAFGIDWFE